MHVSPAPVQTIIVGMICTHYVNYDNIIVDPMIVVLANITAYIILRKYKQNKNFKGGMSRSAHAQRSTVVRI